MDSENNKQTEQHYAIKISNKQINKQDDKYINDRTDVINQD